MITKSNIGARWNGYGAIEGVLNKSSDAPMVYRVLVPWLVGRNIKLWKYEAMQVIMVCSSLISLYLAWHSINIILMSSVLLIASFWYDYWDWTAEIIGVSLALVSLPLAFLGVIIHSLSRETAPLVGLVYALHSHDYLGGALISCIAILTLLIVRKIQGKHKLYCKRWMIYENIELLKKGNISGWLSITMIILYLLALPLRMEAMGLLPLVIACITMAKINETRVFVSIVPYAALFISGLIW